MREKRLPENRHSHTDCIFFLMLAMSTISCGRIDEQVSRSVGFRIDGTSPVQIIEKIDCKGETYYLSPEGKRRAVRYQRVGFYLTTASTETPLTFLDHGFQHLFFPLGNSSYWLGARYVKKPDFQIEYNPGFGDLEEVLIFSPDAGVTHRLDINKTDLFFPRGAGILWFRNQGDKVYSISIDTSGKPVVKEASPEIAVKFEEALKQGRTFFSSLPFRNIEQLAHSPPQAAPEIRSSTIIFSNSDGVLHLDSIAGQPGTYSHRFTYHTGNTNEPSFFQTDRQVVLTFCTMVQNKTLWYYELDSSGHARSNMLKSARLSPN